MMTPTHVKFFCRAVDPAEYVDCKRRAAEKLEGARRKTEALAAVTAVFAPRAAALRQEAATAGSAPLLSNSDAGRSVDALGQKGQLPEDWDKSGEELIAGVEPERAVQLLLAAHQRLLDENTMLSQKCVQLQNKVRDVPCGGHGRIDLS